MMMSLLCIYRGYEMQDKKDDDGYYYYSQTETTLDNELGLVHDKIGIFLNG